MNTIVPLISSGVAGPLGVLHLPRLWLKLSLEAEGKLAPGYPGAGKGFDQMVIDGFGLIRDAVIAFIKTAKPTYTQFEAWVRDNATKLDKASIHKLNAAIVGYVHDDATRKPILEKEGLPDDTCVDAINLNNLDDWKEFHTALYGDGTPPNERPDSDLEIGLLNALKTADTRYPTDSGAKPLNPSVADIALAMNAAQPAATNLPRTDIITEVPSPTKPDIEGGENETGLEINRPATSVSVKDQVGVE